MTERSRTLVSGPGSRQRVEAGVCACVSNSAPFSASVIPLGRRKRRGPFLLASWGSQAGTVRVPRSANRCDEMVPGHPL